MNLLLSPQRPVFPHHHDNAYRSSHRPGTIIRTVTIVLPKLHLQSPQWLRSILPLLPVCLVVVVVANWCPNSLTTLQNEQQETKSRP